MISREVPSSLARFGQKFRNDALGQRIAIADGEGKCVVQRLAQFRIELLLQPPALMTMRVSHVVSDDTPAKPAMAANAFR